MDTATILQILERNPSWIQNWLYDGKGYCNAGWLLHTSGIADDRFYHRKGSIAVNDGKMYTTYVVDILHKLLDLDEEVVVDIIRINDRASSFAHNIAALHAYFDKRMLVDDALEETR